MRRRGAQPALGACPSRKTHARLFHLSLSPRNPTKKTEDFQEQPPPPPRGYVAEKLALAASGLKLLARKVGFVARDGDGAWQLLGVELLAEGDGGGSATSGG